MLACCRHLGALTVLVNEANFLVPAEVKAASAVLPAQEACMVCSFEAFTYVHCTLQACRQIPIFKNTKGLCEGEALGVMQHVYVYECGYAYYSLM